MQYVYIQKENIGGGIAHISKKLFDKENAFHLESHPNYHFPNIPNISIQLQFNMNLVDFLTKVRSTFSA